MILDPPAPVIIPESNYTPPPPHALHIWNAQDLYFHKKIGDSSGIYGKMGFDRFCEPNLKKKINLDPF
jgi:hypothetical protein